MRRPNCDLERYEGKKCRHKGWVHARSAQEIIDALAAGQTVYDEDGDEVVEIRAGRGVDFLVTYESQRDEGRHTYSLDRPSYVLLQDAKPVTEEEMSEVYRILGVKE